MTGIKDFIRLSAARTLHGVLALAGMLILQSSAALAGFTVETGNVTILNPSAGSPVNLKLDHTNSDTNMFAFTEATKTVLSQPVAVDFTKPGTYTELSVQPGIIAKGTTVNTYFFHSEVATESKEAGGITYNVTVKFDEPIIGGQILDTTLRAYDNPPASLGNPNVTYPPPGFTGLENDGDVVVEKMDAETIRLKFVTFKALDELRVFTVGVPEPASLSLAFCGIAGLGAFVARKRLKKGVA